MNHVSEALQGLAEIQRARLQVDDAREQTLLRRLEDFLRACSPDERHEVEAAMKQLSVRARTCG